MSASPYRRICMTSGEKRSEPLDAGRARPGKHGHGLGWLPGRGGIGPGLARPGRNGPGVDPPGLGGWAGFTRPGRRGRPAAPAGRTLGRAGSPDEGMGPGRQSGRGGPMLEVRRDYRCCDRFAGTATTARTSRRRMLKAAVFGAQDDLVDDASALTARRRPAAGLPAAGQLPRALTGVVHDVSPHVLVLGTGGTEQRIALTAAATAWRGGPVDPAGLQPGDQTVVRLDRSRRGVADRIWANIGRVTGVIVDRDSGGLLVDEGKTKPRQLVRIPEGSAGRIQVRFPNLEPGFLIDVIGLRQSQALEARIPGTSQPAYPVDRLPVPPMVSGHAPMTIRGSATWHDPCEEPPGLLGVSYPALDPEAG